MKVVIICVGRIKETFYEEALLHFKKQILHGAAFEILEVKDEPCPETCSTAQAEKVKAVEGARILKQLTTDDYVVALAIEGRPCTPVFFTSLYEACQKKGRRRICFVIGGSLGLWDTVKKRADCAISFSAMTFPHQLMRVILLEQIAMLYK